MRFYCILFGQILKCLSVTRLWNFCKLTFTFILSHCFKIHRFTGLPAFVSIEPTNICNLRCPECPTGNQTSTVGKGKITVELCQNLMPQIEKTVFFANLYFQGEPFVNEQMISIIKTVSNARILTSISTNAHFITEKNADEIVKSGLTKLIISLDGYDQKSYETYRRNGTFQKVLDGMKAIVELQCLLFKHTENHKNEIRQIGKEFGADVIQFKTAQFYDEQNIEMLPSQKNSRYTQENGKLTIKNKLKNKCWKMWSSCIIAWNGNVLPYTNFRKLVHTEREKISMCQNCTS